MSMPMINLHNVHARMAAACLRVGRAVDSVRLLAVSKTFEVQAVQAAVQAGQLEFGENYIQEGVGKIQALAGHQPPLLWHCIGPVQSNKTRTVAEHFDWVHSIDKLKTAQRLSDQRPAHLPPLQVCLQVNIDGGAAKSGVPPEDALALARAVARLPRLQLRGVMTIPEPQPSHAAQLAVHQHTKQCFDDWSQQLSLPHWDTLSMGMSSDLEAAIEAGSTLVRVGTAVFGQR